MRWHMDESNGEAMGNTVSIPKRVSDALAHPSWLIWVAICPFQSLRGFPMRWHNPSWLIWVAICPFQSLRGFPMRWHRKGGKAIQAIIDVSIPKRVSDALAQFPADGAEPTTKFQSLRGFPMRWHWKRLKS